MGTVASLIFTGELPLCVGSASGRGDLPARSRSGRLRDGSGDRSKLGKIKADVVEVAEAHAVSDRHIERGVGEGELVDGPLLEAKVGEATLLRESPRRLELPWLGVEPDHLAWRDDLG